MKNSKIIFISLIMLVLVSSILAINSTNDSESNKSGIEFSTGTWDETLALAKKENKPIFLDISASWCGYCKKMKSKVYTDAEVANYYNSNFINVSVDGEKGEGADLARKYGVKGFPTFVFINPDGSLTKKSAGYQVPGRFLELGKSISIKE